MTKVFGFTDEELKLLLVSVRQMRRTFTKALNTGPKDPNIEAFAARYDKLYAKLRDMTGPLPETVEGALD